MVNNDRKQERRRKSMCCFMKCSLETARCSARIDRTEILNQKKPNSLPGFEPGPFGQNTVAQLLAPPPPSYKLAGRARKTLLGNDLGIPVACAFC